MAEQNWIDSVMSDLEHIETPRSWIWWSLCSSISAAMGNNYNLKALKGALDIRANLYVILLGESGLGKEFPISLSTEIVEAADVTRLIAGRSSIQAIVKELSTARTRKNGKPPFTDSRGFIVNGELSTAVISDPDSLTTLTDLYDRKETWTNLLKGEGAEKLVRPYITCLFGSSPAHFYDKIPQANIEGGYIGRNLIVQEERRYKDTDLLDSSNPEVDTTQGLPIKDYAKHLDNINKKSGRILYDSDTQSIFNEWRRGWRSKELHDKTGFNNRVPVHALKVSMCLCMADYDSELIIRPRHMEEAIERVVPLAYVAGKTMEGKGIDPLSAATKKLLDFLIQAPDNTLRRKQLLVKGYGDFDSATCDKILENLQEIKWIKKTRISHGRDWDMEIELAGEPKAKYLKFLKDREALEEKKLKRLTEAGETK